MWQKKRLLRIINQYTMEIKKILSFIALIAGVILLITGFMIWGVYLPTEVLILNIIVVTIIYALLFVDVLLPWVQWSDPSQRSIGTLGLRWTLTVIYAIVAILLMVIANLVFQWWFVWQLFAHGVLWVLLILAFVSFFSSYAKVAQVHQQEEQNSKGVQLMKNAIELVTVLMIENSGLSETFINRVHTIKDELRYLAPSNTPEARTLEAEFVQTANELALAIPNYTTNSEQVEKLLSKLEHIYKIRKSTYSN
jgi:hypothetical protein